MFNKRFESKKRYNSKYFDLTILDKKNNWRKVQVDELSRDRDRNRAICIETIIG